jgi:hypothetical protein
MEIEMYSYDDGNFFLSLTFTMYIQYCIHTLKNIKHCLDVAIRIHSILACLFF